MNSRQGATTYRFGRVFVVCGTHSGAARCCPSLLNRCWGRYSFRLDECHQLSLQARRYEKWSNDRNKTPTYHANECGAGKNKATTQQTLCPRRDVSVNLPWQKRARFCLLYCARAPDVKQTRRNSRRREGHFPPKHSTWNTNRLST